MKTKLLFIVTFLLLSMSLRAQDFPSHTGYVNDFVGVLDQQTRDDLASKTKALKDDKNIELGIAVIATTGGREIAEYGTALARAWGIGAKDGERRGLLLIVATQDRKSNIQVSRHLEGDFTDGRCGEMLRLGREDFKVGNFGAGVTKIADAVIVQAKAVGTEDKSATTAVTDGKGGTWLYVILGTAGIGGLIVYRRRKNRAAREELNRLARLRRETQAAKPVPSTLLPEAATSQDSSYSAYTPTPESYTPDPSPVDSSASSSNSSSDFGGGDDFGGGGASDSW
jgi:uncharacterized membrane protein YgcG